jgi:hypothetical protein
VARSRRRELRINVEIERKQSLTRHNEAVEREPPVEIGELVTVGVKERRSHPYGSERAVCKNETVVFFLKDCT